jgi:hypothetical protein
LCRNVDGLTGVEVVWVPDLWVGFQDGSRAQRRSILRSPRGCHRC